MIKANDLIHNGWYMLNGKLHQYDALGNIRWKLECYEPIPLTPEILVKAGFVNGKLNKFYVFGNGNLTVEGYEADYNGLYIGNIKNIYVHQLQNLYFALTGDELNIEL